MPAVIPEYPTPPDSNLQIAIQDRSLIRYIHGPFDKKDFAYHKYEFEKAGHDLGDEWSGGQIICIKLGASKEMIIRALQVFCVHVLEMCKYVAANNPTIAIVIEVPDEEAEIKELVSEAFDHLPVGYSYQPDLETAKKWTKEEVKKRVEENEERNRRRKRWR